MKKYVLFVGLNDKDTKAQEIPVLSAYKMAMNVINTHCDGGTISEAQGFYKHDDGTIVIENSLRVELLFVERATVLAIVNELKIILNQESIIMQSEEIQSEMI